MERFTGMEDVDEREGGKELERTMVSDCSLPFSSFPYTDRAKSIERRNTCQNSGVVSKLNEASQKLKPSFVFPT